MSKRIVREAIWLVWWLRFALSSASCEHGNRILQDDRLGQRLIVLDGRHAQAGGVAGATRSSRICDRRMGAGADGFVILDPDRSARAKSGSSS